MLSHLDSKERQTPRPCKHNVIADFLLSFQVMQREESSNGSFFDLFSVNNNAYIYITMMYIYMIPKVLWKQDHCLHGVYCLSVSNLPNFDAATSTRRWQFYDYQREFQTNGFSKRMSNIVRAPIQFFCNFITKPTSDILMGTNFSLWGVMRNMQRSNIQLSITRFNDMLQFFFI